MRKKFRSHAPCSLKAMAGFFLAKRDDLQGDQEPVELDFR